MQRRNSRKLSRLPEIVSDAGLFVGGGPADHRLSSSRLHKKRVSIGTGRRKTEPILPFSRDPSRPSRCSILPYRPAPDGSSLFLLQVLDASGEPGSGFTEGNNNWVGKVHQCNFLASNTSQPLSTKVRQNNSLYRDPLTEYPPFHIRFYAVRMLQNSTMQYHAEIVNEVRKIVR